jgi:hypothetical protein
MTLGPGLPNPRIAALASKANSANEDPGACDVCSPLAALPRLSAHDTPRRPELDRDLAEIAEPSRNTILHNPTLNTVFSKCTQTVASEERNSPASATDP